MLSSLESFFSPALNQTYKSAARIICPCDNSIRRRRWPEDFRRDTSVIGSRLQVQALLVFMPWARGEPRPGGFGVLCVVCVCVRAREPLMR